jgi:hypothetical protein
MAFLEAELRNAIPKALGLDSLQALIVAGNIKLRDMIHIFRTAVEISGIHPEEERQRLKTILQRLLTTRPSASCSLTTRSGRAMTSGAYGS